MGPEEEIVALVIRLASDLEAWIARAVAPLGLTEPQALLIRRLRRPMSMGTAAEALHCDASNLTGIVDRLEKRGLVERRTLATAAPGLSALSGDEQEALIQLLHRALEPREASTSSTE
jgi:DNA-binding MarR family transcriptional regulator